MNLAFKYPIVYWNTACLITDSASSEGAENKTTDYNKIARAMSSMKSHGIEVSLVNINTSDFTYKPDVENNRILYGLNALTNINREIIELIKAGRPYVSFKDFYNRCGNQLKKPAVIALIKAGAFDEIETILRGRREIMAYYLNKISDKKNKINLQNFSGLITNGLVPKKFELQIRIYNFTKYIRKNKYKDWYVLDEQCQLFFDKFVEEHRDELEVLDNGNIGINQKVWDKIYKRYMDIIRDWMTNNQQEILKQYNTLLFKEVWNKYALGNLSKWEMESLCFYHSEHELANINLNHYGISEFKYMNENGDIDYYWKRGDKQIPIYKIKKIIGTVIAKNDSKNNISLLTTSGVVDVKFSKDQYVVYNKQISIPLENGKKKVVETSWFKRGSLLMIAGYRRGNEFVAKTYKNTPFHQIYKITDVNNNEGTFVLQHQRYDELHKGEQLIITTEEGDLF